MGLLGAQMDVQGRNQDVSPRARPPWGSLPVATAGRHGASCAPDYADRKLEATPAEAKQIRALARGH